MKILNFGSLNYDYVYSVNHIVKPGETILSDKLQVFCGGKGLNQSVALARTGEKVYHAGMVGEEGELLINTCKNNHIDVSYIKSIEGKSGHTIIQVDEKGQNCIILYGGSNHSLTEEFIEQVIDGFEAGDWLVLQNEVNLVSYIIDKAYEKGLHIVLNPSPYNEKLEISDLSKVSLFLLNEIEGDQFTGKKDYNAILDEMITKYPDVGIVLTLGSDGVIYKDMKVQYFHGCYKVQVEDTTAAGDTFTGYFIHSLIHNQSIPEALQLASKAAAIAVSRNGATASIPYINEVIETELILL